MSGASTPWLGGPPPSPDTRLRLFCFPYAGGGASAYQAWVEQMPDGVELCRIQLPGRENRFVEPALDQVAVLLPQLADALQPFLDVPFAFFGHSMGAMISFELVRHMRRQGGPLPVALFPSGHRGPHMPLRRRKWARLPEDELIGELRAIQGIPEEVLEHEELLELVLPTIRSDLRLYEDYDHRPDEPLTCPFTVFGGDADELVPKVDLDGWAEHTTRAATVHFLPGGHFFAFSRGETLPLLTAELERLRG